MRDDSKRAEVVIFTDPDVAGRQYRQNFIKYLPLAKHAFVSRYRARCKKETNSARRERLRRGVCHGWSDTGGFEASENAEGPLQMDEKSVANQGRTQRKGVDNQGRTRGERMRQSHLRKLNLSNIEGEVSAKRLRQVLGNVLGIGECDAKQLLRQLNMFFSPEEFEEAMKNTVELLESGKADEWDFTVGSDEEDFGFDPNAYIPPGQAPPGFE